MWKQQIDWDVPLNEQFITRWLQVEEKLPHINKIEIPRFAEIAADTNFEIHGFAVYIFV